MIVFKDRWAMGRWVVSKVWDGWSPGAKGPEASDIIHEMPNRPPYGTDWTEFIATLPDDLTILVEQRRLEMTPRQEFVAIQKFGQNKNKVLGQLFERDRADCFVIFSKHFPDLVEQNAEIVFKKVNQLRIYEKNQLDNSPKLS